LTAKIIAVANQKGGSAKTTTSLSVAGALGIRKSIGNRENRVLVVDADAQETAVAWARAAPDKRPFPATVIGMASYAGKMHREIQRHLENYDYIVIDCPPSVDAITSQSALLIADLVIVPVPPAPADLWSCRATSALIERIQVINPELKAVLLATKVQRTSLSRAVLVELENFGIPLMRSRMVHRTAYQEAILAGTTVAALGRDARIATIEVSALVDEVLEILGGHDD
jgi:chromosome partitioning protein